MNVSSNQRVALIVVAVVLGMVAMSFAAVPAYRAFCQITGFDGSVRKADIAPGTVLDRKITVRFDANVANGLPWRFKPEQVSQTIQIGETALAHYSAENLTDQPIIGTATFNVQPAKAGLYFRKIECFCFTEQLLEPGQAVSMPVTWFVDPQIANDPTLDDIHTITLSYTFYRNEDAEKDMLAAAENPAKDGS